MVPPTLDYVSVGGNRQPSAADWDLDTGELAFGADQDVALWKPIVCCRFQPLATC
jgi:elongator complex protein 2